MIPIHYLWKYVNSHEFLEVSYTHPSHESREDKTDYNTSHKTENQSNCEKNTQIKLNILSTKLILLKSLVSEQFIFI